jgi:NADH-quinone oxidoreductase subunit M
VLEDLGGLGKLMPFAGFAFGLGAFAAIGLPGFANFAAEIMIFFGAFRNGWEMERFHIFQIATLLALWGVVISAVYMLRAYRKTFMGPLNPERARAWKELVDLRPGLRVPVAMLVATLLWVGFYPQSLVQIIAPASSSYSAAKK